ncbi:uncharacterized protein EI90DRAFT_550274 [Cantharellus anzutake]|uniref:uncharacterized protein n=1 Tax=Cantharellus anzutake TaxID=1750568 RepID=UPI0019078D57|nr:uncharacterized protein EI90DRAFT_550274 [Cantharellus anzutake]KAF8313543.1 hypothetical protein EI90DRAFT_550274 [Cantharellus anzutake]
MTDFEPAFCQLVYRCHRARRTSKGGEAEFIRSVLHEVGEFINRIFPGTSFIDICKILAPAVIGGLLGPRRERLIANILPTDISAEKLSMLISISMLIIGIVSAMWKAKGHLLTDNLEPVLAENPTLAALWDIAKDVGGNMPNLLAQIAPGVIAALAGSRPWLAISLATFVFTLERALNAPRGE